MYLLRENDDYEIIALTFNLFISVNLFPQYRFRDYFRGFSRVLSFIDLSKLDDSSTAILVLNMTFFLCALLSSLIAIARESRPNSHGLFSRTVYTISMRTCIRSLHRRNTLAALIFRLVLGKERQSDHHRMSLNN